MAYTSQQNFRNDKVPKNNFQNFKPVQKGNVTMIEAGNLHNNSTKQYVQHVQHVPHLQNVQKIPYVPKVHNVQIVPKVQNVQIIPNIPKVQNVQIVPNAPNVPIVQNAQSIPIVQNVPIAQSIPIAQNVQNVSIVQNVPSISNMQSIQNIQNIQNLQNLQNLQNIQNIQNMQNLQNMQNIQNIQNLQNMQNIQNMKNIQHIQHMQNVQSIQNLQNIQQMQHMQNMQKLQHMQNMQKLQLMQNMQNIQNIGKNSFGFFNYKDFPALKVPGKFSSENKNEKKLELTSKENVPTKSCDIKNEEKTASETFAAVVASDNKYVKQVINSTELVTKEKEGTQTFKENNASGILDKEKKMDSSGVNKEKKIVLSGVVKGKKNVSSGGDKEKKNVSLKDVSVQVQTNHIKKKRNDPIVLNFEEILAINKAQKKTKQQHNTVKSNAQKHKDKELLSGNLLDSSNPKRSRGKHREIKKQKLSNLKLTIIKERIIKRKMREKLIEDPEFGNKCFNLIQTIDFEKEVDSYLKELNEKKLKIVELKSIKLYENTSEIKGGEKENFSFDSAEKIENDFEEEKIFPNEEIKFSSKFREYCDNIITPELNTAVAALIKGLIKLQDRLFLRDPIKAKAKKRHVSGLREVKKYLNLKKVKMIIIAPNLEKLEMKGSVYDSVNQFKLMADGQNVPYGFALDRYKLGKLTKKNVPISAFAVLNYEGIETLFNDVLSELLEAKKKFFELTEASKEDKESDPNSQIVSSLISAFREELKMQ